jgi:hypothetical protein
VAHAAHTEETIVVSGKAEFAGGFALWPAIAETQFDADKCTLTLINQGGASLRIPKRLPLFLEGNDPKRIAAGAVIGIEGVRRLR